LDAELPIDLFGEAELLEERGVGTPIPWPTQRVVLLVSEGSDRRSAEDAQVGEVTDCPVAITTGSGLDLAVDVRTASSRVRDASRIEAVLERQAALDRGVRVELPASDDQISRPRDAAKEPLALADGQFIDLREHEIVISLPACRAAIETRIEEEVTAVFLNLMLVSVVHQHRVTFRETLVEFELERIIVVVGAIAEVS